MKLLIKLAGWLAGCADCAGWLAGLVFALGWLRWLATLF